MKKIKMLLLVGILGLLAACATVHAPSSVVSAPATIIKDNTPVCVYGVGIANNPDVEGKYLYGSRLPIIGINPYDGHLLKAVGDYLNSRHNSRVVEDLERVYQEYGRIDMAFFHSAVVVALNDGAEKLDESLMSGKLRFGKIALAGVHVQPKLAAVLDKHKAEGNIDDWVSLERAYIPGKQKGDFVVLMTTPNREFRSPIGAILIKAGIATMQGIVKFPALISGGAWDVKTPFYDFKEHLVEVYTPDARKFFGLTEKTDINQIAQVQ